MEREATETSRIASRHPLAIAVIAGAALLLHLLKPLDLVAVALIVLGLTPWLAGILSRAELPGGWKLEFARIETKQAQQQREIESLRFLVAHFVSEFEIGHLRKLSGTEPFLTRKDRNTPFFEAELRRLLNLGLIGRHPNKGVRSLFREDGQYEDVREHLFITDAGRKYLELRKSYDEPREDGRG